MPGNRRRTGGWSRRIDPLIGPAAAIVLAAATGFFCFALPDRIVAPWLTIAGLSPTPGARGALALVEASLTGLGTWGLFRLFDPPPATATAPTPLVLARDATPVLRRADAHPDAPARRPIFAGSDLGTPFDMLDAAPADRGGVSVEALPRFSVLEDADPAVAPPAPASPPAFARPADAEETPPLAGLVGRLEAGLARRASPDSGADAAPPGRELPPFDGGLGEAIDRIERGTGRR